MPSLSAKLDERSARICVMGLGHVGLPLAVAFAEAGFSVHGYDVSDERVASVAAGDSHTRDVSSEQLRKQIASRRLVPTDDPSVLADSDVILICVPTPLRKSRDPDISHILDATREVVRHLRKGQLIVLESTTSPGTTEEELRPLLEERGFAVGTDLHLVFSPERFDPGNPSWGLHNTPKVVGGSTPACQELAIRLYETITETVVPVSSPKAAEMVKLLENTYRAVNIGLVNELAIMCDKLGLDVWEVIEAAATKPFGFTPFYPGPGLGGHCIPVDPLYLSWKLRTLNYRARFIELADDVNRHMPDFVVQKAIRALNGAGRSVRGSEVLIVGVAYKSNVADTRESPALDVIVLLKELGGNVAYYDPLVENLQIGDETMTSISETDLPARLDEADLAILVTRHDAMRVEEIVGRASLVLDCRNATADLGSRDHVVKL